MTFSPTTTRFQVDALSAAAPAFSGIWLVLNRGRVGESYNIGGNNQPPNIEIVDAICDLLDEMKPGSAHLPHRQLKQYVTDRPGHDRRYAMDITKINRELGWEPRYELKTGLHKTVEWYLANPNWTAAIRQQKKFNEWVNQNYSARGEK